MESTRFIREDLKIFRGTAQECFDKQKAGKVQNLEIYLAWDTGEIFVGNKQGALVKYGGGTSAIERELSKAIDSFKSELNEYTERTAREVINEEVQGKLDTIEANFAAQTTAAIQTIQNSVDEKIGTINASIEQISALDTAVNGLQTTLQDIYRKSDVYTKDEVTTRIRNSENTLNNSIDSVANRVTALENSDTTISTDIDNLETEVENVKTNYATKEYVDESHPIRYLRADQMAVASSLDLPDYCLVFCTSSSAGSSFLAGALYYYDPMAYQFRMISGGGNGGSSGGGDISTTILCRTTFNLSYSINGTLYTSNQEVEVNSTPLSVVATGNYTNTQSGGAISESSKVNIDYYIDNVLSRNIISANPDNSGLVVNFSTATQSFDISLPRVHKLKMYATVKPNTAQITYEIVNNNVERTVTVYQPCLFGTEEAFTNNNTSAIIHRKSFAGEYQIQTGTKYILYVPTSMSLSSSVIKQAFVSAYNYEEDGTEQRTWNGVQLTYKKYIFNARDTDFAITIVLS